MKRSNRKQALTNRMTKVGLYWADTDTKHKDGFYHITTAPRVRPVQLRTLDKLASYIDAHERAAKAPSGPEGDEIICDFWVDLAA